MASIREQFSDLMLARRWEEALDLARDEVQVDIPISDQQWWTIGRELDTLCVLAAYGNGIAERAFFSATAEEVALWTSEGIDINTAPLWTSGHNTAGFLPEELWDIWLFRWYAADAVIADLTDWADRQDDIADEMATWHGDDEATDPPPWSAEAAAILRDDPPDNGRPGEWSASIQNVDGWTTVFELRMIS